MEFLNLVQNYSSLLIWVLGGFCTWLWWSLKTKFITKETYQVLYDEVSEMRLKVKDIPGLKDFHKMQISIEHMCGEQKEQKAILERVEKILDRQQDYLMTSKDR